MNMVDIINHKRLGYELTREEISFAFTAYLEGEIPDYQMSSLLMAICLKGMSDEETFFLTDLFLNSGERFDLSSISSVKVDKHSTGGVGDKTTLVLGPVVASCGVRVPKMSGRGLGHTGGTIDKLESIPGFRTSLTKDEFFHQVEQIGFAVTSQTGNLVPMDKKIYALRDVTGTVSSIPLIASSIMSKKLAGGADKILIDIKVGRGALLQTEEEGEELSRIMIEIGKRYRREVRTVLTDMNVPLGNSIGNSLEVLEAMRVLKNEEKGSFYDLCVLLASHMVSMGKEIAFDDAKEEVLAVLENGEAYRKFMQFVEMQGGNLTKLPLSTKSFDILSKKSGTITAIDALKIGTISMHLGAGRESVEDAIDPRVGIVLRKSVSDSVLVGDVLCTVYLGEKELMEDLESCFVIS